MIVCTTWMAAKGLFKYPLDFLAIPFFLVKVLSRIFSRQIRYRLAARLSQKLAFCGTCLPLAQEKVFAAFPFTLSGKIGWCMRSRRSVDRSRPPIIGRCHVAISNHRLLVLLCYKILD